MNTPAPILALVGHRLNGFDRLTGADGQTVTYASSVLREFDALLDRVTALKAQQLDERLATAAVVDDLRNQLDAARPVLEAAVKFVRTDRRARFYKAAKRVGIWDDAPLEQLVLAVRAYNDAAAGVDE